MRRDQSIWLVVGLVGSMLVLSLMAWLALIGYRQYKRDFRRISVEPKLEDASTIWQRQTDEYKREQTEWLSYSSQLRSRYTTVSPFPDLYKKLHADKDIAAVEMILSKKYAAIDDPYQGYNYSRTILTLGRLDYRHDPAESQLLLQKWTEARPDSHVAWLVRGTFEREYAWYWRAGRDIESIAPTDLENFRQCLKAAEEYLERAGELDPNDPVVPTRLLQISIDKGESDAQFKTRFDRVMALSPTFYDAYYMKLLRADYKKLGAWHKIEQLADECDKLADELHCPLLRLIRLEASIEMARSRPGYENSFERPEVRQMILGVAKQLVDAWPDVVSLRANYCYFLYYFEDYPAALDQFEWMGDRYYEPSLWPSLAHYNTARAYTIFRVAADSFNEHALRVKQFERAIAMDDAQGIYWYYLGVEYTNVYDLKRAEAAFRSGLEKDPGSEFVWFGLVAFLAQSERYDEVIKLVRESKRHYDFSNETRTTLKRLGAIAEAKQKELTVDRTITRPLAVRESAVR